MTELRSGLRSLAKNPGFALSAILMLALGIGANTAIFSLVEAVVLTPLSYRDPDRLVVFHNVKDGESFGPHSSSRPDFEDWRYERGAFASTALFSYWTFNLTGREIPMRVTGGRVTGDFFSTLGVEPLLGRTLTPEDDAPGSEEAVVLSHGIWTRLFGADEDVLGRALTLNGRPHVVVGVMPPEFRFPAEDVEIWGAVGDNLTGLQRHNRFLLVVARLAPGASLSQAQRALDVLTARLEAEYPESNEGYQVRLVSAHSSLVGEVRPALLLLLAAVGVVLLIACTNVSNLLLARATERRREAATRVALGAGWTRLLGQYATESLLIAGAGGAAGVVIAHGGLGLLLRLHPGGIPRLDEVEVDSVVLGFAVAISLGCGLVLGLVPSLDAWRRNPASSLKAGGRMELGGSGGSRLRDGLVVVEVAMALVLLVGGGLLLRSFAKLTSVDPGFRPDRVLTMSVFLTPPGYRTIPERQRYVEGALVSLASLPGVRAAAAVTDPPLGEGWLTMSLHEEGRPLPVAEAPHAGFRGVSDGYFRLLGIPLLAGRDFDPRDDADTEKVVVVNESFARRLWPGEDPIGRRIRWADRERDQTPMTVVGVVADIRNRGLDREEGPVIYAPIGQITFSWLRWFTFALDASGDPEALAGASRDALLRIDPDQPVFQIRTLASAITASLAERRFQLVLVQLFAACALVLAALGVYGVISQTVAHRTSEIGLRLSLGARRHDIFRLFVGEALRWTLVGIASGFIAAFAVTPLLASMLFAIEPADPATFAVAATLLAIVALAASYIPARRAAALDPVKALRSE